MEPRPPDEIDDTNQNDPVDCSAEQWAEIYADPDFDLDHDHSMDG